MTPLKLKKFLEGLKIIQKNENKRKIQ